MERASVQVIVPSIGRASLRQAVESIQSDAVICSAIVVLDRPSETSRVKSLLEGLDFVLVITQGGVGGAAARNLGVDHATSPIVAFLDDDDTWLPGRLSSIDREKWISICDKRVVYCSAFEFVRTNSRDFTETRQVVPKQPPPARGSSALTSYLVARKALRFGENALQSSSVIVAREVAQMVRWDDDLRKHQDWDFVIRCLEAGLPIAFSSRAEVAVYQDAPGSVSKSANWRASKGFYDRHVAVLKSREAADFWWMHLLGAAVRSPSELVNMLRSSRPPRQLPHLAAVIWTVRRWARTWTEGRFESRA